MPPSSQKRSDVSLTEIDLTPLDPGSAAPRNRTRNRLMIGAVVLVLGFVLFQALTSARVFFRNVDEAVAERAELGDQTFRMQGVVVSEPAEDNRGAITFAIAFNDVEAEIVHVGEEPSDLFELGMPVVVEGHWQGDLFTSQQILVKHSESYVADNEERPGVGENGVDGEPASDPGVG